MKNHNLKDRLKYKLVKSLIGETGKLWVIASGFGLEPERDAHLRL